MDSFDKFQRSLITFLIAVATFYAGYYFGESGYLFAVRKSPPEVKIVNRTPTNSEVDFGLFWAVWDSVSAQYLERPVDTEAMLYGAISGMVSALEDPYTSYLPPVVNETVTSNLNGIYEGIGAELGFDDSDQLIIVSPLDGSPAKAAGVQAGDKILEIDGSSTSGITLNEAVTIIRGESGTQVVLTLAREGSSETIETPITRGQINVPSITWEDKGNGTAYIRVSRFGEDTNGDWANAVKEINIQMNELDAIIIDVRGNPGGYLQSAVFIASEFYTDSPVVIQEDALGEQISFDAERIGLFEDVPAVYVLIDEGSASASEIVAGALRDVIDAELVGETSFGKGTIQTVEEFSDGSGVHITIAKWLTPNETWVHKVGLEPDHFVELTSDDVNAERDPQLDKALELADQI